MSAVPIRRGDRAAALLLTSLTVLAWLALLLAGSSPYARYLDHHVLVTQEPRVLVLLGLAIGWLLMIVAMMLPTTWPLVQLFGRLLRQRAERLWFTALLLLGYLTVWLLAGSLALAGDLALHELLRRAAWSTENGRMIAAAAFVVAGAYQFSGLKYRCLTVCRTPRSFIAGHWRGRSGSLESFAIGVRHGTFCLGCCWSLMLLTFAVGAGSITWMLVVGTIMASEKNFGWGRRLSAPLGIILLGCGFGMALLGPV